MSMQDLRRMHPTIAEVVVYNRVAKPREMRRMFRYMARRYTIGLSWRTRLWWWWLDLVGR